MSQVAAAGIMAVEPDGRVLMLRRSGHDQPGKWAFPGGGIEEGEDAEAAARREYQEETGTPAPDLLVPWTHRDKDGVEFFTFRAEVAAPFNPTLNNEHDAFHWLARDVALGRHDLHPGAMIALLRPDLDEMGVAKAIRAGELTSPQRFANLLLIALRITGTGAAYRQDHDEFVWRDPSLYLNEAFVARCNGLPVILEHPDKKVLDSKEYRKRNVGSIVLPYIQGDEVWGIAKIYDDDAQALLIRDKMSTSPAVVVSPADQGSTRQLADGQHLLVEGRPSFLDHVAICERGVWDKGGEPTGVLAVTADSTDTQLSEDIPMADAKQAAADDKSVAKADSSEGIANSKEGASLDKVLAHLDSLHESMKGFGAKHDEICGRMDAYSKRIDAFEENFKSKNEAGKGEEEGGEEEENVKDGGEPEPKAVDAKKDDEEQTGKETEAKALTTEREENKLERNDSEARFNARFADLEKRLPVHLTEADRQRFVTAQVKAERVAQAFGDSAGAPRWLNGETLSQYQRRLMAPYKVHSAAWKDKDLAHVHESVLDVAEAQIYADAITAAARPQGGEDMLREVITTDDTGRRIRKFYGSPEACWGPFKHISRLVTGMKPPSQD